MASNSLARPFPSPSSCQHLLKSERLFIDSLLARIHIIIVMIGWTGLAPWEFEFPFPDSLTSHVVCPQEWTD